MKEDEVTLRLTKAEALVLFDWLARCSDEEQMQTPSTPEWRAIWSLEAEFERQLVEPFREDYRELVEQARRELVDDAN